MKTNPTRSLSEHITEALSNVTESSDKLVAEDSAMILEYLSYRISTPTELLDGLKEINAPIQIDIKNSSVSIDGVNYRVPKNINDTGASVNWDSKLYDALHKNDELTAMWKTVNHKYSSIINNLRKTKSVTGIMPNPEYIDWGTTGAANINSYFQAITKLQKMLQDILANKDAQDTLRKYEVLRHLFDRGYDRMFGLK